MLQFIGTGKNFFIKTPVAQKMRSKIYKQNLMKLKASAQQKIPSVNDEEASYRLGKYLSGIYTCYSDCISNTQITKNYIKTPKKEHN